MSDPIERPKCIGPDLRMLKNRRKIIHEALKATKGK